MNYTVAGFTDIGKRDRQEDSILYEELTVNQKSVVVAAVADGIGGLMRGEVAGGYVIERIFALLFEKITGLAAINASMPKIVQCIKQCLFEMAKEFEDFSKENGIMLGSTLSLLVIVEREYAIVHIGDSKIYLMKKKRVVDITPIHRNEDGSLNRCIGSFGYFDPYIKRGRIRRNMGFLLCSDGFWQKGREDLKILNTVDIKTEEQISKRLVTIASKVKQKRENDNISALFLVVKR